MPEVENQFSQSGPDQTAAEYHVASYLAQISPGNLETAKEMLQSFTGVEIHGASAQQKLVITIEGDSHSTIAKIVDLIQDLTYINSLVQIYHQYTDEEE